MGLIIAGIELHKLPRDKDGMVKCPFDGCNKSCKGGATGNHIR